MKKIITSTILILSICRIAFSKPHIKDGLWICTRKSQNGTFSFFYTTDINTKGDSCYYTQWSVKDGFINEIVLYTYCDDAPIDSKNFPPMTYVIQKVEFLGDNYFIIGDRKSIDCVFKIISKSKRPREEYKLKLMFSNILNFKGQPIL